MKKFTLPKFRKKTFKRKKKGTYHDALLSNEQYHQEKLGPNLKPYYSSSVIKNMLARNFFRKKTYSLDFGHKFHTIIETFLKYPDNEINIMSKSAFKKMCNENVIELEEERFDYYINYRYFFVTAQGESEYLYAMFNNFKNYWKGQHHDNKTYRIEESFFTDFETILNFDSKILPASLKYLHDFLVKNKLSIKTRPDLLRVTEKRVVVVDWKNTAHVEYSKIKNTLTHDYHYLFSVAMGFLNCFYHGLAKEEDIAYFAEIVFFPKVKGLCCPVSVNIDFKSENVKSYMREYSSRLTAVWTDRLDERRKIKVGETVYISF